MRLPTILVFCSLFMVVSGDGWYSFFKEAIQGTWDLLRAYWDSLEANCQNSDRCFHARGNFEAQQRGAGGIWAAKIISRMKLSIAIVFCFLVLGVDSQRWFQFMKEAGQGTRDMWRAYSDMREANWKNSDKYFHARGNYDAAQRGPGGVWAAKVISGVHSLELDSPDIQDASSSPFGSIVIPGSDKSSSDDDECHMELAEEMENEICRVWDVSMDGINLLEYTIINYNMPVSYALDWYRYKKMHMFGAVPETGQTPPVPSEASTEDSFRKRPVALPACSYHFCPAALQRPLQTGPGTSSTILNRNVPCIPTLSKAFIMKGCWILSNAFSASNEMIMCCYISNFISDYTNLDALSLPFEKVPWGAEKKQKDGSCLHIHSVNLCLLLVGKIFFNGFVEYVFYAFELVFFSFFYSYYSKVRPFHGVPDFLDILCYDLFGFGVVLDY
ncbi:hypothetical protein STEG23_020419 [Scotinomys teguina]